MEKKSASFGSPLNPKPAIILTCRDKNGKNNATPIVYACNCSYDPPMIMIGLAPSRHSHAVIKESGSFIVNLVPPELKEAFGYLGSTSGRDIDKLAISKLTLGEGVKVNAPILSDCPVNIECKVVDSIRTGSHVMFVGRVEHVQANAELLDAQEKINWEGLEFLSV